MIIFFILISTQRVNVWSVKYNKFLLRQIIHLSCVNLLVFDFCHLPGSMNANRSFKRKTLAMIRDELKINGELSFMT